MPMPIRPVNESFTDLSCKTESHNFFMMNLDSLADAAAMGGLSRLGSIHVNAEATDKDAELLLELFNQSQIVAEAESAEDKKYAVPKTFSGDNLLRLKAASLVSGDAHVVKFTSKAIRVIKTLVLAEQNAYTKTSVMKPYSVILAENKAKSSNRSTLAFERTAALTSVAQMNRPIDSEYMPTRITPYIYSRRLTYRAGTSDKQYIIRLFEVNGRYAVLAWNGRNGSSLKMQQKGTFQTMDHAYVVFLSLLSSKIREGYHIANEIEHPDLLGRKVTISPETAPLSESVPASAGSWDGIEESAPVAPVARENTVAPVARDNPKMPTTKKMVNTLNMDSEISTLLEELEENNNFTF